MMNARRSARTRSKFFSLPFRMAGQPTNFYLMINTEMRRRNRTKRTQSSLSTKDEMISLVWATLKEAPSSCSGVISSDSA
jgi:hypothetical protein